MQGKSKIARPVYFLVAFPFFTLFVIIFLTFFILPVFVKLNMFTYLIKRELSKKLGTDARIAKFDLTGPDTYEMQGLEIKSFNPYIKLFRLKGIKVNFLATSLLFGKPREITLELNKPYLEADIKLDDIKNFTKSENEPANSMQIIIEKMCKNLPNIMVRDGRLKIFGKEIIGINGAIRNTYNLLSCEFSGKMSNGGKLEKVQFIGEALYSDGGSEIKTEIRAGELGAGFEWQWSPDFSNIFCSVKTLPISKEIKETIKDVLNVDLSGIVTATANICFENGKIQKVDVEGHVEKYCGVFQDVVFANEVQRINFQISLKSKGTSSWHIVGKVTNLQARVNKKYKINTPFIFFDVVVAKKNKNLELTGNVSSRNFCAYDGVWEIASAETVKVALDVFVAEPIPDSASGARCPKVEGKIEVCLGGSSTQLSDGKKLYNANVLAKIKGAVDYNEGNVEIEEGILDISDIGEILVNGKLNIKNGNLQYVLSAGGSNIFVGKFLKDIKFLPRQAELCPISIDINLEGSNNYLKGDVNLDKIDIAYKDAKLENLSLYLPFCFAKEGGSVVGAPNPLEGRLHFGRFRFGKIEIANQDIVILSKMNGFFIDTINLPVFGGVVKLDNIAIDAISNDNFCLRGLATFSNIDISKLMLLGASECFVEGNVSGCLPFVLTQKSGLEVSGDMIVNVFGGVVKIYDIHISSPFSNLAKYKFSLNLRDIDIEKISSRSFGLICGTLEGDIKEVELGANFEPVQCEIHIYTVNKGGVSQKVDIKGVKNLAMVVEGNNLEREFLGRMPPYLYYSRFGIYAVLKNDKVYIRGKYYEAIGANKDKDRFGEYTLCELRKGIVKKNVREYIMVGNGFFRLNIINLAPQKGIFYSDIKEKIRMMTHTAKR